MSRCAQQFTLEQGCLASHPTIGHEFVVEVNPSCVPSSYVAPLFFLLQHAVIPKSLVLSDHTVATDTVEIGLFPPLLVKFLKQIRALEIRGISVAPFVGQMKWDKLESLTLQVLDLATSNPMDSIRSLVQFPLLQTLVLHPMFNERRSIVLLNCIRPTSIRSLTWSSSMYFLRHDLHDMVEKVRLTDMAEKLRKTTALAALNLRAFVAPTPLTAIPAFPPALAASLTELHWPASHRVDGILYGWPFPAAIKNLTFSSLRTLALDLEDAVQPGGLQNAATAAAAFPALRELEVYLATEP